jgi:hypothetical protein
MPLTDPQLVRLERRLEHTLRVSQTMRRLAGISRDEEITTALDEHATALADAARAATALLPALDAERSRH